MTPIELEPRRFCRTFEELRHVAADPPPFQGATATYSTPRYCLTPSPAMCFKCRGYNAAVIEYTASLTTWN